MKFLRNVNYWAESAVPRAIACISALPDLIVGVLCFECGRPHGFGYLAPNWCHCSEDCGTFRAYSLSGRRLQAVGLEVLQPDPISCPLSFL